MLCGLRALHVRAPVSQENHVGVTLHVTYTDAYPDEPPMWELEEGKREVTLIGWGLEACCIGQRQSSIPVPIGWGYGIWGMADHGMGAVCHTERDRPRHAETHSEHGTNFGWQD